MLWDVYDLGMLQVRLGEEILNRTGSGRIAASSFSPFQVPIWPRSIEFLGSGLASFNFSDLHVQLIPHESPIGAQSLGFGHYLGGLVPSNPSPTMNRGSSRAVTVPSRFYPPSAKSSLAWRSPEENNTVRGSNVSLCEDPRCRGVHGLHSNIPGTSGSSWAWWRPVDAMSLGGLVDLVGLGTRGIQGPSWLGGFWVEWRVSVSVVLEVRIFVVLWFTSPGLSMVSRSVGRF
jgi:hypothetical protein